MAEQQFVIFKLGKERYGVNIENVSSISESMAINPVPNADERIKGIVNLRGEIIPVINMKKYFGYSETEEDENTRIIIYDSGKSVIGFHVDDASQVVRIDEQQIEKAPEIIKGEGREFIEGVGKLNGEIIILLKLDRVADTLSNIASNCME